MDHFGIILILVTQAATIFQPTLTLPQRLKSLEQLSKVSSDFFLNQVKAGGLREQFDRDAQMQPQHPNGTTNRTLITSMAYQNLPQPRNDLITKQMSNPFVVTGLGESMFNRPINGEVMPQPPTNKPTFMRPGLRQDILSVFNNPKKNNREQVPTSGSGMPSQVPTSGSGMPSLGEDVWDIERTSRIAATPQKTNPAAQFPSRIAAPPKKANPAAQFPPRIAAPPKKANPAAQFPSRIAAPPKKANPSAQFPPRIAAPPKKADPSAQFPPRIAAPPKKTIPPAQFPLSIYNTPMNFRPVDQIPAYDNEVESKQNPQSQTTVNVKSTDPAPPTTTKGFVSIEKLISKQDELFGLILQYHTEVNRLITDILAKINSRGP